MYIRKGHIPGQLLSIVYGMVQVCGANDRVVCTLLS